MPHRAARARYVRRDLASTTISTTNAVSGARLLTHNPPLPPPQHRRTVSKMLRGHTHLLDCGFSAAMCATFVGVYI